MSGAVKTALIVGGVGAAVFVVAKVIAAKPRGAPPAVNRGSGTVGWDIGGLVSSAASIFGTVGDLFKPSFDGNSNIDPATGGVRLPEGQQYGPPSPV